jgi:hypothetical protein
VRQQQQQQHQQQQLQEEQEVWEAAAAPHTHDPSPATCAMLDSHSVHPIVDTAGGAVAQQHSSCSGEAGNVDTAAAGKQAGKRGKGAILEK